MKPARLLLLLLSSILLLLVVVSFSLFEFRFQHAEMAVESNASTFAFGSDPEGAELQAQAVDLYVLAPKMLEPDLSEALREEFSTNPYFGQINLREMPPAPGTDSVLVLTMEDPQSFFWTPLSARSALTVDVAYASDGEVEWIGAEVMTLASDERPDARVVRVRGEYAFENIAYGLLSRPGYTGYLAGEMAKTVNQALADTLANQYGTLSQK